MGPQQPHPAHLQQHWVLPPNPPLAPVATAPNPLIQTLLHPTDPLPHPGPPPSHARAQGWTKLRWQRVSPSLTPEPRTHLHACPPELGPPPGAPVEEGVAGAGTSA